jgi:hypothetical protein
VTPAQQAPHHVRTHSAETDHAHLHCVRSLLEDYFS